MYASPGNWFAERQGTLDGDDLRLVMDAFLTQQVIEIRADMRVGPSSAQESLHIPDCLRID